MKFSRNLPIILYYIVLNIKVLHAKLCYIIFEFL